MKISLYLAWMIALIATLASIYFGEIVGAEPCRLCWYQRICMFPLSYLLAVAVYTNDPFFAIKTLPLVCLGALIAFYQVLSQQVPSLQIVSVCGESHCTLPGPMPTLSALAFVSMAMLILISQKIEKS